MILTQKIVSRLIGVTLIGALLFSVPAAAEEPENIWRDYNNSFEQFQQNGEPEKWTHSSAISEANFLRSTAENPAQDGEYFINMPQYGDAIYLTIDRLSGNTNYNLSFYTRTSVKNAGYVDIRFRREGILYEKWCKNNAVQFVNGTDLYQEKFGVANESETESLKWYKAEFNFTLPEGADGLMITVKNNNADGDAYFCLDNFSLTETGDVVPNLIKNGRLEAFKADGIPSGWVLYYADETAPTMTFPDNGGDGNHFLKSTQSKNYIAQGFAVAPGRYVISFRYKSATTYSYMPGIRLYRQEPIDGFCTDYQGGMVQVGSQNSWMTYKMYFTVPDNSGESDVYKGYNLYLMIPGIYNYGEYYYDDIVCLPDTENRVDYVNTWTCATSEYNAKYTSTWVKGNDLTKIRDASKQSGTSNHQVTAVGHYIPKTIGKESFGLVSAVYSLDKKTGMRRLMSVNTASGETENGIIKNITLPLNIQAVADDTDNTVEIRSFITRDKAGKGLLNSLGKAFSIIY